VVEEFLAMKVYVGIVGGTCFNQEGGANYLCMPWDPEYSPTLRYRGGVQGHACREFVTTMCLVQYSYDPSQGHLPFHMDQGVLLIHHDRVQGNRKIPWSYNV
jgi:hypothetical protein